MSLVLIMMVHFNTFPIQNNVVYLTSEKPDDSATYLAVRKKENRILSDKEVAILPYLKRDEWKLREKSTQRFIQFLSSKANLSILDIGCGNGWFCHQMASVSGNFHVIGLDVNRTELEQAARVFRKDNLRFVYASIFDINTLFDKCFDVITVNGTVQYFPDFNALFTTLVSFLKPQGELHVIDSPFYTTKEIPNAKTRTKMYYSNLGFPEMAKKYYHHDIEQLKSFETLYQHKKNIFKTLIGQKDSPYLWVRFVTN